MEIQGMCLIVPGTEKRHWPLVELGVDDRVSDILKYVGFCAPFHTISEGGSWR